MTTTIRLRKDTVNKINALEGKSQDDKINSLLQMTTKCSQNVVYCSNPTDSDKLDNWFNRIETALKAQSFEIKSIKELINAHIN